MADDSFTPEDVAEMLAEEGRAVLLSITTPDGEYVPGTGVAGGTLVEVMTMGVLLPFSRGLRALPNSGIESRDQQLLLAGDVNPGPTLNTTVAAGGNVYSVVEVNPMAPQGEVLYYDCTVRGAQ
jgi:hypothetical protein